MRSEELERGFRTWALEVMVAQLGLGVHGLSEAAAVFVAYAVLDVERDFLEKFK